MPLINWSEATKVLSDQTENGNCANVMNCRISVGLSQLHFTLRFFGWEMIIQIKTTILACTLMIGDDRLNKD